MPKELTKIFFILKLNKPFCLHGLYTDRDFIQRGTWRNGQNAELCQCRCLPCGFESLLVRDFQRNISPLNIGTLLRCCVLGKGTTPSNTLLDSDENDYLVGQRWQCV